MFSTISHPLATALAVALLLVLPLGSRALAAAPVLPAVIKARLPHDPAAFTQGLLYHDGALYESTGLYGQSSLRRIDAATGKIVARRSLPASVFGEGLVLLNGLFYQLTWREGRVLTANPADLSPVGELPLPTEGWGVCALDGKLVVSDGSDTLTFYDPTAMTAVGSIAVTDAGTPVTRLNELELVAGRIWANVWGETRIAVIDPASGRVVAWVDCSGLRPGGVAAKLEMVLNGIASDPATGRVWVTGKHWSEIFEITTPGLPTGGVRP
ncbi:glutaminyl-peptide cyclotransferase [Desulfovibrio aerotolerans]|uniref:Glutaminyl-peptide cyclotransferase n=1 Tax=Solidesulfovibrio aerotolerans TaxID=295255 RepID=A0A7C9MII2_9BACT|nr:glutaminyl-peptide cyclotransferase [Solidesulfovibrio aerotolerans]MYL83168.1 glutaminyl-peptide cyclotransferase [Solidesulfovibrio aerotolerans]